MGSSSALNPNGRLTCGTHARSANSSSHNSNKTSSSHNSHHHHGRLRRATATGISGG